MEEDHSLLAWDASRDRWQAILNEQPIPPRRAQRRDHAHTAVRARLMWERDGQEYLETVCWAWTSELVLVAVQDPRRGQVIGVWLPAADVTRR